MGMKISRKVAKNNAKVKFIQYLMSPLVLYWPIFEISKTYFLCTEKLDTNTKS